MYSSIDNSEVVLAFERSNPGLKKLSIFSEYESDSSAFLNATCLLKHVLDCERGTLYRSGWGTVLQAGRGFETRWDEWIFWIYLILPAALGPGVYSSSNRNEYQKQKNNVCGE
jgi:hypothetical protein